MINKREARVFIYTLTNRPDEGRDIQGALRLRAIERKFREYLGEYYDDMRELTERMDEINISLVPGTVEYHQQASEVNKAMRALDEAKGMVPAANEHHEGILLDHDEFKFLDDKFKNMKNIPAAGKSGEIWEGIYEAFKGAKDTKVRPVESKSDEEKAV